MLPQEKVLGIDEADDVVQIAFVDRQPREAGHGHGADDFVGGRIDVQGVDFNPRPHDVADGAVAQPQGPACQQLLGRIEQTLMRTRVDQALDVFDGNGLLPALAATQLPEHDGRGNLHGQDQSGDNRQFKGNWHGSTRSTRIGIPLF